MDLETVKEALLLVMPEVYHYTAPAKTGKRYIVWAEDSSVGSSVGNNHVLEQGVQGTIDLFTDQEYDPAVKKIQKALAVKGIPFRLNSVQYETDTNLIHHEWVFSLGCDPYG